MSRPGLSVTVVDALLNCAEIATFRSEQNVWRGRLGASGARAKAKRLAAELNEWDALEEAAGR